MYKHFFGLRANPFSANPDPRFLLMTRNTREVLACLNYGVQNRKGFMVLSGEVGTGKTTLLQKLLQSLKASHVATAYVFNPRLDVLGFLHFMMTDFGIRCESRDKSDMLLQLNQWLLSKFRSGETAALIVDEAQNLLPELLEEIRLLTNLETSSEKLLQIVLAGQPELDVMLRQPQLRQLRQRILFRCRTFPLTPEEVQLYIQERIRLAGGDGVPIFTSDAVDAVVRFSQGVPRVVNLLCEHSLVTAFADQSRPVAGAIVEEVAREFELDELPPLATESVTQTSIASLAAKAGIDAANRVTASDGLGLKLLDRK
jgi:type II secretory pathway predicted ATPase ExeA